MEQSSEFVLSGPEDIPRVRRLVAALTAWPDPARAELGLVLTELVTNGYLHGEAPVTVRVRDLQDRVRVEVADAGRALPVRHHGTANGMTGRGFALIATLSQAWGVDGLPEGGKVVWAELTRNGSDNPNDTEPDLGPDALLAAWPEEDRYAIALGAVPTALLLAAKAHIDDVVRELALARGEGAGARPVSSAIVMSLSAAAEDFADGRGQIKAQALAAAARGDATTDLTLRLPASAAPAAARYLAALEETDRLARAARMLTLAPPRSFVVLYRWYLHAVVGAFDALGRGEQPAPVTPFASVLAAEVDSPLADPPAVAEDSARFALELAVRAGGIATFDWDLRKDELVWDPRLLELFGQPSSGVPQVLPIDVFYGLLHPGDRDRVIGLNERAIAECGEYDAEYRIVLPNGRERWIAARGLVVAGADGQAERFLGAAQDTTERRHGEARVARVMDSMATAFFFLDREWRFSFLNAEAERVLSCRRDDLLGRSLWEEFPAALGSPFETHYRRAVEAGEPVAFDAFYPEPLNAWYEVRAWPNPDGLAVYFIDVTDRRAAEQSAQRAITRAGLLARVTEKLAAAVEPEAAVAELAQLVVPALGTWCAVTLVDDDRRGGTRSGLGYAFGWHADPDLCELADHYARTRLAVISDDALVIRAVESGALQVLNDHALDRLSAMFPPDSEPVRILREFDTQAVAVLPLPGQETAVGMLSVGADSRRGPFSAEDVDLLRDVAARAGLVLDRARLYRQQRAVAETLQRSLLQLPAQQNGVEVAVRYVPAAEVAQVGGDWYDAIARPDGTAVLVIGDVMGHDVLAAAAMSETRTLVRTLAARSGSRPAAVLAEAERVIGVLRLDALATVVVAQLEPAEATRGCRLRFSNAGHPPPLVLAPDGEVTVLGYGRSDPLLGVPWAGRTEQVAELAPGSTIVLYTDGLVERRDQPVDVGVKRLVEVLERAGQVSPEALCDQVLAALKRERPEDDIALLIARLPD